MIEMMAGETDDETDFTTLVASDPAMRRHAVAFARRAQQLRGFALGLYAEALVASELGATLSPGGTDDADMEWRPSPRGRPVTIQVRSCRLRDAPRGARGSVDIGKADHRARLGEVWVFAMHAGEEHRVGWRFLVRSAKQLENFGRQRRVAVGRLAPSNEWLGLPELPAAVRAASRR